MSEIHLNDQNFDSEILNSQTPAMVDFWAEWCGPCKLLGPIVDELAKEFAGKNVKIGKLNVDESGDTAMKFSIMSIPTLLFFKSGQVVDQIIGVQSKEEIRQKLMALIG